LRPDRRPGISSGRSSCDQSRSILRRAQCPRRLAQDRGVSGSEPKHFVVRSGRDDPPAVDQRGRRGPASADRGRAVHHHTAVRSARSAGAPPPAALRCARRCRHRIVEHVTRAGRDRASLAPRRCRCPPDIDRPCSPILVSSPHGRSYANDAGDCERGLDDVAFVASGCPIMEVRAHTSPRERRLLKRTRTRQNKSPVRLRKVRSRTSWPSRVTQAAGHAPVESRTAASRPSSSPEPVAARRGASVSPGWIARSSPLSTVFFSLPG